MGAEFQVSYLTNYTSVSPSACSSGPFYGSNSTSLRWLVLRNNFIASLDLSEIEAGQGDFLTSSIFSHSISFDHGSSYSLSGF